MSKVREDDVERRARFWIQGTTDFDKGNPPRWGSSHSHYVHYMQGYEYARKQAKRHEVESRKANSLYARIKRKVLQWFSHW